MIVDKLPKRAGAMEMIYVDQPIATGASFIFSGSAQGPTITDTQPEYYTVSGDLTGINAGTYTITWTLKKSRRIYWSDNTKAPKTYTYEITKKRVVPPIFPETTVSIEYTGSSITIPYIDSADASWYTITNASHIDAGTYTVKASLNAGTSGINVVWDDTQTTASKTAQYIITPKTVTKPIIGTNRTFTFNSEYQGPTITNTVDSSYYTITDGTKRHAGIYSVVIHLKDSTNSKWEGEDATDITAEYTINKKTVAPPTITGTSYTYNGSSQGPSIVDSVDSSFYRITGNRSATSAGSYTIRIDLKYDADSYWTDTGSSVGKTHAWSIAAKTVRPPTVTVGAYTYNGTAQGPTVVHSADSAYYNVTGTTTLTKPGSATLTVSLKSTTNTVWTDGSSTAKSYPYTVSKLVLSSVLPSTYSDATLLGKAIRDGGTIYTDPNYPQSMNYWQKYGPSGFKAAAFNASSTGYSSIYAAEGYGFYNAWYAVRCPLSGGALTLKNAIYAEYPNTEFIMIQIESSDKTVIANFVIDASYLTIQFQVNCTGWNQGGTYMAVYNSGPGGPETKVMDNSATNILRRESGSYWGIDDRFTYTPSMSVEHYPGLTIEIS